jgi:hypothetical protein
MSGRTRNLKLGVASILLALTAAGSTAHAGQSAHNLRPIGPHEPILASIGEKRLVASFAVSFDRCALELSVWASVEAAADSSVRATVDLDPGEIFYIENPKNRTEFLGLQCGDSAKTLLIKASNEE